MNYFNYFVNCNFKGNVWWDIFVLIVKDVCIWGMVMNVNSGVYVNYIYVVILKDVSYKVNIF